MLEKFNGESYIGAPLAQRSKEIVIGSIALLYSEPVPVTDDVTLIR